MTNVIKIVDKHNNYINLIGYYYNNTYTPSIDVIQKSLYKLYDYKGDYNHGNYENFIVNYIWI